MALADDEEKMADVKDNIDVAVAQVTEISRDLSCVECAETLKEVILNLEEAEADTVALLKEVRKQLKAVRT